MVVCVITSKISVSPVIHEIEEAVTLNVLLGISASDGGRKAKSMIV